MLKRILLWGVLLLAPLSGAAHAQTSFGFAPGQTTQTISASTVSSSVTLPSTAGNTVFVANTGANTAYITNGATATTGTGFPLPAGANVFLSYPAGSVVSAITASSTTTLLIVKGNGASAIGGGGSGGGGGGGAVTMASGAVASGAYSSGSIASGAVSAGAYAAGALAAGAFATGAGVDGWDLSVGATTASAATAGSTGTMQAKLRLMTTQLDNINTNVQAAIPAGTAIIGKVGIDQTTFGTTNAVASFNSAGKYETVAASQTGQTMGPTGATGDYLSHCTVYPTSTSPGVVTVFDSTSSATNNVITFAGGSSSISNLVPFTFPVGAFSVNGAWKVTTGANLVVTCYGKFT